MGVAERKEASQRMSQQMKERGEERISGICPVCYQRVSISYPQVSSDQTMAFHLQTKCKGTAKAKGYVRKGNNVTDLRAVIERHKGKDNYRGLVYADLVGMGWSKSRINRMWDFDGSAYRR